MYDVGEMILLSLKPSSNILSGKLTVRLPDSVGSHNCTMSATSDQQVDKVRSQQLGILTRCRDAINLLVYQCSLRSAEMAIFGGSREYEITT